MTIERPQDIATPCQCLREIAIDRERLAVFGVGFLVSLQKKEDVAAGIPGLPDSRD